MNSLRAMALFFMVAAVSLSGKMVAAQQEVAPDHFDTPAAQAQKAAPVHRQRHDHAMMAKKGSAKHHHSHASA